VSALSPTAPMAAAIAPVAKKKGKGKMLLLILAGVFVVAIITAQLTVKQPAVVTPPPTAEDLSKAQQAGLSKEFAAQAWLSHRYVANTQTRLLTIGTDADITLPADEVIRDGLKATKSSIHNPAEQLAFDRMYALLWAVHTSPSWKLGEPQNPVYQQHAAIGSYCFSAVLYSFGRDPEGMKLGGNKCLTGQRKLQAEEGKSDWNDL